MLKTILLVEDNEDDQFFMKQAQQKAGIQNPMHIVHDGQQALDYLKGAGEYGDRQKYPLPFLVLLDLKLPVKSGFEVLHWVRAQPEFHDLKVVILSGSEQTSDVTQARAFGVVDYIVKPTSPAQLVEILRERKAAWLEPA